MYTPPCGKHQKVQLVTTDDLLNGRGLDYPKTFKAAQKVKANKHAGQLTWGEEPSE